MICRCSLSVPVSRSQLLKKFCRHRASEINFINEMKRKYCNPTYSKLLKMSP